MHAFPSLQSRTIPTVQPVSTLHVLPIVHTAQEESSGACAHPVPSPLAVGSQRSIVHAMRSLHAASLFSCTHASLVASHRSDVQLAPSSQLGTASAATHPVPAAVASHRSTPLQKRVSSHSASLVQRAETQPRTGLQRSPVPQAASLGVCVQRRASQPSTVHAIPSSQLDEHADPESRAPASRRPESIAPSERPASKSPPRRVSSGSMSALQPHRSANAAKNASMRRARFRRSSPTERDRHRRGRCSEPPPIARHPRSRGSRPPDSSHPQSRRTCTRPPPRSRRR